MARTEFRLGIATMLNDQYGDDFLEDQPDLRHQIQEKIKQHLVKRIGRNRRPYIDFLGDTVMSVSVMVLSDVADAVEARLDDVPDLEFVLAGNRVSIEFEGIENILDQPPAPPPGGVGPAAAGAGGPAGGKRRKTRKVKKARRKSTRRRWFY